jgi:hypothetical protein
MKNEKSWKEETEVKKERDEDLKDQEANSIPEGLGFRGLHLGQRRISSSSSSTLISPHAAISSGEGS